MEYIFIALILIYVIYKQEMLAKKLEKNEDNLKMTAEAVGDIRKGCWDVDDKADELADRIEVIEEKLDIKHETEE